MTDEREITDERDISDARAKAANDDARIAARLNEIMQAPMPQKGKSRAAAPSTPGWLKKKAASKPPASRTETPKAKERGGKKGPQSRPPKGSDESWQLAAEHIARKQAEE